MNPKIQEATNAISLNISRRSKLKFNKNIGNLIQHLERNFKGEKMRRKKLIK